MARVVSLVGGSPWGFTLSGGKDFGSHLKILKLTPGGKAATGGVNGGDYILAINDTSTEGLSHHQAQQLVRSAGSSLTLKLTKEQPKVAAVVATATFYNDAPPSTSGERPRPPPAPSSAPEPTHHQPPPPQKPVATTSAVPQMPKASPSEVVPDSGLYTGAQSSQQSPSFKKITVEAPSKLSPRPPPPPQEDLSHQMKNVTIDEGGVRKTSQRPAPPPSSPSTFSTTSMKVASGSGPKTSPIAKPAPPPTVQQSPTQPPPSPQTSTTPTKMSSRQGVCEKCHEPIRGPYASALGKVWHTEHFTCCSCNQALTSGTFVFEDEDIFCENCYEKKVAKTCHKCHKSIVGPTVSAADHFYHHSCFLCSGCGVNLTSQEGFNMENNQLFCKNCFNQSYGTTCRGCQGNIGANDLWVEALEHNWHPQCFVCTTCRRPLEGGRFFAKFDQPYCSSCA